MIFTRIVLENYGLFAGRNEFDLRPREKRGTNRPIVLFGGKNGAGKTTFLDAIRLLFYGRRSLGERMGQRDYELALVSKIHRNKILGTRAAYAKIGIEFEYVKLGEKKLYFVERSWNLNRADAVTEFFRVEENGKPLEEISSSHWEAFVSDIVPERLSQLFFFDGEKIKSIAEDTTSNAAISEAIQSLLGLDTVQALKSDLLIYRSRLLKAEDPSLYGGSLADCNENIRRLNEELEQIRSVQDSLRTEIDGAVCSVTTFESKLQQRGGSLAEKRGHNLNRSTQLRETTLSTAQGIREFCDGPVPFVMCPSITELFISQVTAESTYRDKAAALRTVDQVSQFLIDAASGDDSNSAQIHHFVSQKLDQFKNQNIKGKFVREIHALSDRASFTAEELVSTRARDDAKRISQLSSELERSEQALEAVEKDLALAPDEEDLAKIVAGLTKNTVHLGELRQKQTSLAERQNILENDIAQRKREHAKLEFKLAAASKQKEKLQQIEKVGSALEEYRKNLTMAKIQTLQAEVTRCFNKLARKEDFVREIRVDPTSFSVHLLDQHGVALPKEELSSGEKQIFAIALLWGLARTSGRPLPVVVDTPLGRLDSDHRSNLIINYFPHAGHQVILLSTDTEVDQTLLEELSPAISHCHHLHYESKEGRTISRQEYFWRVSEAA